MATLVSSEPAREADSQGEEHSNLQYYADNFNRLCRLCLSSDQLVSIYSSVQGRNVYYMRNFVKFALELLAVKINIHDKLPKYICESCERSLSVIFNFKQNCDKSMAILQRVNDSIIKNKESYNVDPEDDEREPKVQRRRRRRQVSKHLSCEELLKKLPPTINVGKLGYKRTVQPDVTPRSAIALEHSIKRMPEEEQVLDEIRDVQDQASATRNLNSNTTRKEGEQIFNEVLDVKDLEHEVLPEESPQGHSEEHVDRTEFSQDEKETDELKIEGELIELLEIAENELETEKNKSNTRRRVVCPVCGAMVNNVKSHLITHSDVRPHQCDQCPKSFATRNKLQSHTNSVHLRKRDFKCEVCGKAFLEKNNLKGHMRIHSGERKYTCDICAKSFLFAGTLRCHKLTHTQEKKHECKVCGKLFLMRTTLNKHLNVHTDERPHKCDLCDKRFRTSTHKVVHMRTHTGEKPLVCYICEMSFAHHKARSVHMKSKHPEELVRMGLIDDRGHLKI